MKERYFLYTSGGHAPLTLQSIIFMLNKIDQEQLKNSEKQMPFYTGFKLISKV